MRPLQAAKRIQGGFKIQAFQNAVDSRQEASLGTHIANLWEQVDLAKRKGFADPCNPGSQFCTYCTTVKAELIHSLLKRRPTWTLLSDTMGLLAEGVLIRSGLRPICRDSHFASFGHSWETGFPQLTINSVDQSTAFPYPVITATGWPTLTCKYSRSLQWKA